jgi:C_GCAxxG_C_C family probable redox protein
VVEVLREMKDREVRDMKSTGRRNFLATACCIGSTVVTVSGQELSEFDLTTEDRVALALMRFKMGFHCSQCVLEAYSEDFGIDGKLARKLANGLGGGSTVGGECGAVASGYLVLGLRYGNAMPAHGVEAREKELWDRIRQFVAEFRNLHGSINCRDLLGVDVFTPEGRDQALKKNLFETHCPRYIQDSITILDSL